MPENNGANNANNQNLENNNNVGTGENGDGGNAATHAASGEGENAKTFTQEEVNQIVQERIAREKKGLPSKEDMDEFNKWKDSQKSIEEKSLEKDKTIAELNSRIENMERMSKLASKNVDKKFQKFVMSEVASMGGDFDTDLDSYLKENQQYIIAADNNQGTNTGVSMNNIGGVGANDEDDGATKILKAKHPELFK